MGGGHVTRREALMVVLAGIAMITAGLTWMFGPYGLIGTGAALVVGVPVLLDERPEKVKTDA